MKFERDFRCSWHRSLLFEGGFPAYFFFFSLLGFSGALTGLIVGGIFRRWDAGMIYGLLMGWFLILLIVLDIHFRERIRRRKK